MNRTAAVALIEQGLGFRSGDEAKIVVALQQAQRLLEKGKTLPEFLRVNDEALVIPVGANLIPLPDRFIRVADDNEPYYVSLTASRVSLERVDRNTSLTFLGADAGYPKAYRIEAGSPYIYVYPNRDVEYTAVWSYYRGGEILDTDIENVWLEHNPEILIGKAGMLIAEDLVAEGPYAKFQKMHQEAWASGFAHDELDREADAPLYMGEYN